MGHFKKHQARVKAEGPVTTQARALPLTPAQQHKLRVAPEAHPVLARAARHPSRAASIAGAASLRQQFEADVESLHGISVAAKVERKRELIETYRGTVEGLLAAGAAREKLFTWWILWLYDVGAIEQFIPRARQAIAHGWLTSISRDLQTFLWDMVLEWALAQHEEGNGVEPYFGQVYPSEVPRMLEVVQAKYHKFAGDLAQAEAGAADSPAAERSALELAKERWEGARAAYDKAGVDTRIAQAEKRLAKLAVPEGDKVTAEGSPATPGAPAKSKSAPASKAKPKSTPRPKGRAKSKTSKSGK